jgi:hypothetical protein
VQSVAWWERVLVRIVLVIGTRSTAPGHGEAHGLLRLFQSIEGMFDRHNHVTSLAPGSLVRYQISPLPARDLALEDGQVVRHGEQVVILHFDNHVIASLLRSAASRSNVPWEMFKLARIDLVRLATLTQDGTIPLGVRVLWGESVVYPALVRVGFKTRPGHRRIRDGFERLYMLGLLAIYGEDTLMRLEQGRLDSLRVGEAWMSVTELQRRYLPRPRASADGAQAPDQQAADGSADRRSQEQDAEADGGAEGSEGEQHRAAHQGGQGLG